MPRHFANSCCFPLSLLFAYQPVYGELFFRQATLRATLLHLFLYVIDFKRALNCGEAQVQIEHGIDLPASEFSGGRHAGQANAILEACGFVIVPKTADTAQLPLELFSRYGRKEIFAAVGMNYDPQQLHLNGREADSGKGMPFRGS
jgi:hypothetical protein